MRYCAPPGGIGPPLHVYQLPGSLLFGSRYWSRWTLVTSWFASWWACTVSAHQPLPSQRDISMMPLDSPGSATELSVGTLSTVATWVQSVGLGPKFQRQILALVVSSWTIRLLTPTSRL